MPPTTPPVRSWRPGEIPDEIRQALERFVGLSAPEQVLHAFAEAGIGMVGKPPYGPNNIPSDVVDEVKRSWNLRDDNEAREAAALAGLVTVGVGDLAQATRNARHPVLVAKSIAVAARGLDDRLREIVPILRERGCSWTEIGAALGISKQSAWERFSGEE